MGEKDVDSYSSEARPETPVNCSRQTTLNDGPNQTTLSIGVEGRDDSKLCAMYVQEATEHDNAMLQGSHASLDVLLIMAGLFSAVLTAFLIESYTLLQPDPQDAALALLTAIVDRLETNQTKKLSSTVIPSPNTNSFTPSLSAWLINAFWFFSLVCSLSAAFVAMLAKQWLQAYTLGRHGRIEIHARQRHLRYSGFLKWLASDIIYTLPVILQFSFSLFFVGLDILVWSINKPIGYLVIFCTALLLGFYLFTNLAPLFDLSCPYRTPFSLHLAIQVRRIYFNCWEHISQLISVVGAWTSGLPIHRPTIYKTTENAITHVEREHIEIEKMQHSLDLGIIEYLVGTSHQEDIVNAALIAISTLRPNFSPTKRLRDSGAIQLLIDRLGSNPLPPSTSAATAFRDHVAESLPYLASLFCSLRFCTRDDISPIMNRFGWRTWIVLWGDFTLQKLISEEWNLDALAIYLCASAQCDRAERRRPDRTEGPRRPNREFNVMIDLLNCHSNDEVRLSDFSVWALVESIATWGAEFDDMSMKIMRPIVTACLLNLLTLPYSMGDSLTRTVGLAFGVFALDYKKEVLVHYRDEERRRTDAHRLLVQSVIHIMKTQLCDKNSRYCLSRESFEAGGMALCKLLVDNNAPTPWPDGTPITLLGIVEASKSEKLTCKVLETFRRLLSFDGQNSLPTLLSSITPLLEPSISLSVQVKATQVIGEMMHWRQHRQAILHQNEAISVLVKNLEMIDGELSNASSLALIDISRDPQATELMVQHGLAKSLKVFFASTNATRHNLAHWSWLFIKSPSTIRQFWGRHYNEFQETFLELCNALEYLVRFEDEDNPRSLDIQVPSSPGLPKQDLQRTIRTLRHICSDYSKHNDSETSLGSESELKSLSVGNVTWTEIQLNTS